MTLIAAAKKDVLKDIFREASTLSEEAMLQNSAGPIFVLFRKTIDKGIKTSRVRYNKEKPIVIPKPGITPFRFIRNDLMIEFMNSPLRLEIKIYV